MSQKKILNLRRQRDELGKWKWNFQVISVSKIYWSLNSHNLFSLKKNLSPTIYSWIPHNFQKKKLLLKKLDSAKVTYKIRNLQDFQKKKVTNHKIFDIKACNPQDFFIEKIAINNIFYRNLAIHKIFYKKNTYNPQDFL